MMTHKSKIEAVTYWLTKKRKGFLHWFAGMFLLLGSPVAARFFFDERSFSDEWQLLALQLGVTLVIALPVGFLMSSLAKGCIVCRDEEIETEE